MSKATNVSYDWFRPKYKELKSQGKSEPEIIEEIALSIETTEIYKDYSHIEKVAENIVSKFKDEEEVIKLLKEGYAQKDIADLLGMRVPQVHRITNYARSIGVEVQKKHGGTGTKNGVYAHKDEVLAMLKEGKSNTEITRKFGFCFGVVSKFRNAMRRKEIAETGATDIPTGSEVQEEIVYTNSVGRPSEEKRNSEEFLTKVKNISKQDAKLFCENMSKLSDEEKERLEDELQMDCNSLLNNGMPIKSVYNKLHNKNWYSRIVLTTDYLEELVYGSTLANLKKTSNTEDVVYYLKGDNICYDYDSGECDCKGKRLVRHYEKPITDEVVDILVDDKGEVKHLLFEEKLLRLNSYICYGKWDEVGQNKYVRRITYKNGLDSRLKELAAA